MKNLFPTSTSRWLQRPLSRSFSLFILLFLLTTLSSFAQNFPSGFSHVQVANGISNPTVLAFAPDGRIFVAEQGGKLRVIKDGVLLSAPFVQLSVNASGERGLIGMALDPNFASNKYIYLYYTVSSGTLHNRVSRFTANGDVALSGSEKVILELDPLSSANNHNGGAMHFGKDGKLYIAVGDNANRANAQDLDTYHGKVLRINADGSVPAGNPYPSGSEQRKRVWAHGLRNPYTFAVQPGTGRIFVNDVGESTWEEINDATTGGLNFGWPSAEGASSNAAYTDPVYAYPHGSGDGKGCAITGGVFFNPSSSNYPGSYTGKYFYQDLCNNWINFIDVSGGSAVRSSFATGLPGQSLSVSVGNDGNLYYLSRDYDALYKIIYTNNSAPVITSQPESLTVSEGQTASFSVSATGTDPLSYQWQKNGVNIAGATGATYTIASTTTASAGYYRVIVSNTAGRAASNSVSLTVTASNAAPTAKITSPANHTVYRAGTVVSFEGTGTDPEDGTLPASAFSWAVEFHHDAHNHDGPPVASGTKSGSFTIPNQGETSVNVWYRLILTVKDSKGLTHRNYIDLDPKVVTVNLATNPAGLQLTLNNQTKTTPYSQKFVAGMLIPLNAPSPQSLNSTTYQFSNWSSVTVSGGKITVPDENTTYTAAFSAPSTACSASGTILREQWDVVSGSSVSDIPLQNTPSSTSQLSLFEAPSDIGGIYGARVRGYICPPQTGNYTFFIASDDNSELWLSSSDSPSSKKIIASVNGWTYPREWDKYSTQKSAAVWLEAGKRYYIEALHKENWGGDNLAVGWQLPDGKTEAPIPGSRLSPYTTSGTNTPPVANAGADKTITLPANSVSLSGSGTDSEGSISSYSWTKVSGPSATMSGASTATLTATNLLEGSYVFRLTVKDNGGLTASDEANVTVGSAPASSSPVVREFWSNVSGTSVAQIPVNTTPMSTSELSLFESPKYTGDNYGVRVRAYVHAPESGSYVFWIASDDHSELWLSTDESPDNKRRIAYLESHTNIREWTKFPSQRSAAITLQAGRKYYIEALHKEGAGSDHLAVGWQLPGGALERPIPGSRLSAYVATQNATAQLVAGSAPQATGRLLAYYPNPFTQQITLRLLGNSTERYTMTLYDATGREVWQAENARADGELTIGKELEAGMYILMLSTGKETKQYKLIKSR